MRRFRGQKFRLEKRNSEKTTFSFSRRNTATRYACCRSAESLVRSTVIRWNSAAARTRERQAKSDHFGSFAKKRLRPEHAALKPLRVTRRGLGLRKKLPDSKR